MPRPSSLTIAALLTALVALGPISTNLYLPALPILVDVFATDVAHIQLTLSLFLAAFAFSQLIVGPLSDRFGRRPVLIVGMAIYAIAGIVCLLATSVEVLIIGRLAQAVGACAGGAVGRAVVRDVHGREQAARILAYMGTAMALAPMVSPIIGGYLTAQLGWEYVFIAMAGIGAVLLVVVMWVLSETNMWKDANATHPKRMAINYFDLMREPVFVGFALTNSLCFGGMFAFVAGSSFALIDVIGLSPDQFGIAFGSVVIGYMVGAWLTGRLTLIIGLEPMILAGATICLLTAGIQLAFIIAGISALWAILVPMGFFMVGLGLVMPNAMAGAIGPFPSKAGAASAMVGFSQMGLAAISSYGVGTLHHLGGQPLLPMSGIIFVGALTSWLAFMILVWPRRHTLSAQ